MPQSVTIKTRGIRTISTTTQAGLASDRIAWNGIVVKSTRMISGIETG